MSTLILHNSIIMNTSKLFQHIMRLQRLGVSMRIILPSLSKSSNMKAKLSSKEMCESSLSSSVKYLNVLTSLCNLLTLLLWSDKICLAKH